jgi:hypothetical protein
MEYAGSNWIISNIVKDKENISPLGIAVADFLGDMFYGIYHLDSKALQRVEWSNTHHIIFRLGWRCLSTIDFDELTILVVLSHDRNIRVSIDAATHRYLEFLFHQRERGNNTMDQMPTLEDHIERVRARYGYTAGQAS